jgi:phosphohistidine phosphatase
MKKILLIRHAKSDWEDPFLNDHERPLSLRGLRDAPLMAQRLVKKNIMPDLIISSDANRAKTTALITAENLYYPKSNIQFTSDLYHASATTLLAEIKNTPADVETLFLIAHNPGLNDLIELLGGEIDNLPTCGQYGFIFEVDSWSSIDRKNAIKWLLDFPKNKVS